MLRTITGTVETELAGDARPRWPRPPTSAGPDPGEDDVPALEVGLRRPRSRGRSTRVAEVPHRHPVAVPDVDARAAGRRRRHAGHLPSCRSLLGAVGRLVLLDRPRGARPEQRGQVARAPALGGLVDLRGPSPPRTRVGRRHGRRRSAWARTVPSTTGSAGRPARDCRGARRGPAAPPRRRRPPRPPRPSRRGGCTTPCSPSAPNRIGSPCTSGISMSERCSLPVICSNAPSLKTLQFW